MIRYFVGPVGETYIYDANGEPDLFPGVVEVDLTTYEAANDQLVLDNANRGGRTGTSLLWSKSKLRTQPALLDGALLASGQLIAIFVRDDLGIGITQVDFKLDGSSVHVESSAPWDYGGTDGFGNSTRISLSTGTHLIEADITDSYGMFTVSANVEVE